MDKIWYVYIVRCKKGLYTGISTKVKDRVKQHNSGKGAKAVKALGLPCELVYQEKVGSKSAALKREYMIKCLSRNEKRLLIVKAKKK
jgi:putative endonuclease